MQWQKLSNAVACSNRKVINVSKELSVLAKEISKPSIAGVTGFPLLLLLLSHFGRVRLCTAPWLAAHQAPASLGFPFATLGEM